MPGAVKSEPDEQTARGRNIKFASCYNSPGKKGEGKWRYGSGREIQSSGLQVQGEAEQTKAGWKSQSGINLST